MELGGCWRVHPGNDELRRSYQDIGFRDDGWQELEVPGHWRHHTDLQNHDGALLYRKAFDLVATGGRQWLWLDGIFYQGDVWLDGAYVGDTEGYFFPHSFEITGMLQGRREHLIAIEVTSQPAGEAAGRALVGAFAERDHVREGWNPGGIWRPVRIETTGPVAIRHGRLRCIEAGGERAVIALRLVLDADTGRTVEVRTRIGGLEHRHERTLAQGENRVEWTVAIARPDLWWPRSLGHPVLHDVVVDVLVGDTSDAGGTGEVAAECSDSRRWRTGLRSVELKNWRWRINGEQVFVKGANIGPLREDPAEAIPSEVRAAVTAATDAGLDALRLHTHIARPELYEAADELGVLLWQDLPIHGRYSRGVRKQALRQAREAVDLLAHHPSIAVWCAHNEPYAFDESIPTAAARQGFGRRAINRVLPQQLPSWNRSILDASLRLAIDRSDGTRPVIAHSGVAPHLPQLDGTDAHLWFGWYDGEVDELSDLAATVPRIVRCVSEFGAQAVPDTNGFLISEAWPDLDWERIVRDHGAQTAVFDQRVSPDDYATFDDWREATQSYQAYVVRRTIEILRRLKYRPTGSFFVYKLTETYPSIGFGLIDCAGRPKAAYRALAEVCRPVIPIADVPHRLGRGQELEAAVHVVSDLRRPLEGARVTATAEPGGGRDAWEGDVGADACVRVGRLALRAPDRPGPFTVRLELTHRSLEPVVRHYRATVI